ncbi:uncharacterized protein LOC121259530 isoform X2 [Juglans microcarpa x Juglans regia]|uniref:uncharacterized protein LOC121259530 isoform X2 n=1 Tax=Juglans microcarpa x Juglans regia TaxID=2249226 RepID=UPI001B7E0588|nr:uncharacterized protein LOC121259530 isoform X2 [Juglans microcarpa x Juglans regia]
MAALQLRPKHRTLHNPSLVHLFSTSSTPPEPTSADQSPPSASSDPSESQSSLSSYFSDVKASLKQQQQRQHRPASPFSQRNPTIPAKPLSPSDSSFSKPSKIASLEEIRRNLSEFRLRSSVPPLSRPNSAHATTPSSESSSQHISFQELYKRNVTEKADENVTNTASGPGKFGGSGGNHSFEAIRLSLRQLRSSPGMAQNERRRADPMSLSEFKNNLKLKPSTDPVPVIGGTDTLPVSVFGKERERKDTEGEKMAMKTEFVKMEDKETESRIGGVSFKDLRESLLRMKISDDEKAKKSSIQRMDILGQLGRTPNFMLQPPKEHLVEKYFHPDNMSSAEKLKIELAKVRDEFKMSESDCGSARVQVAQLTTKIKHLSSVLHKKDKHSRKGLIGMVQMRKRLLKYLRRTDWDSYCLVLSKLGLRDNPNYKN